MKIIITILVLVIAGTVDADELHQFYELTCDQNSNYFGANALSIYNPWQISWGTNAENSNEQNDWKKLIKIGKAYDNTYLEYDVKTLDCSLDNLGVVKISYSEQHSGSKFSTKYEPNIKIVLTDGSIAFEGRLAAFSSLYLTNGQVMKYCLYGEPCKNIFLFWGSLRDENKFPLTIEFLNEHND